MRKKRKADAQEDETNNGCSEATIPKENTESSNAKNVENGNNVKKPPNVITPKKDSKVNTELVVRRSVRINSSGLLSGNRTVHPIVEHVNLVENEQEDVNTSPLTTENDSEREPQAQEASAPEMNERSLEEKVDYLIRTADELKSQFVGQAYARTSESPSNVSYKGMYFESQKKIEALVEEHYDLVRKLEFARGKIEAYESMKDAMFAQKEVLLVSALSKATESTANGPSQPSPTSTFSPPPPPPLPSAAILPGAFKDPKQKKDNRKKQVNFRLNSR